jgi:2-polyprenyl-3-methyl-5-hydroxy-6-metoxy-1,4-benzoquinol methylase
MRYQLVPDNSEEQRALETNPAARTLFDPFIPVIQARAIMSAVKLGILDALNENPLSVEEVSDVSSLDGDALLALLRVLVAAGYLRFNDGKFLLSDLSRETLAPGAPRQLSGWVRFNYSQWKMIELLEEILRTGAAKGTSEFLKSDQDWMIHQQAMLETARPIAGWVAGQVAVNAGATRLLDLGGGHGLYGAMICRNHPPMQSQVLDLPKAVEHARELAQREGIDDVVSHRAGDMLTDDLGLDRYDVVFMGNIVHHLSEEQNIGLLRRIQASIKAGGTVAIWDFRLPEPGSPPDLIVDAFALFFQITSAARCYRPSELTSWLEKSGFREVTISQSPSPMHILVIGRKR